MSNSGGINESEVKAFSRDILAYQNEIRLVLNQFYDIVDKTKMYFKGDAAEMYRKRFKDFSNNFRSVYKCFHAYENDMVNLLNTYSRAESSITIDN